MAQAGVLPEEIVLGRKVDAARAERAEIVEPVARNAATKILAHLMRRNIARGAAEIHGVISPQGKLI